ncbi:MAG TPA: PHP domain-containing protein [Solirubrobacteraceae bacterium]|jgi:predicted metal-dependent phosphoesterase TrpH|nr:PHP domain-containing protein [Solirubrobacteraceae bacterium]
MLEPTDVGVPRFDLQSHSTRSDGALEPAEVVAAAASAGVQLLALTDHDTLAGVPEALSAAVKHAITVVPAIEISAIDDGGEGGTARELHILGYLVDHTDPQFTATLAGFLADREQRTLRMAANLRELGIELDEQAIQARVSAGEPIGRPHLAEAALSHPANAQRLAEEEIDDIGSFIRAYLIEGRPAFCLRITPTVQEAIDAVHSAGGVAIWAHPFWDVSEPAEALAMVDRFRAMGIDGIEAFYVTHTPEQTELLARRCAELDMLSTGSADFHGPENRLFSRFLAFDTHGLTPNLGPIAALAQAH